MRFRLFSLSIVPAFTALFCGAFLQTMPLLATPVVLSSARQTTALAYSSAFTPSGIAYNPLSGLYYGGSGGSVNASETVWNAQGVLVQTAALGLDLRSLYFNSNTQSLEAIPFNARQAGTGAYTLDTNSQGLLTGARALLPTLSGLLNQQVAPAYDAARDRYYAFTGNNQSVSVVARSTGLQIVSIALDTTSAGLVKPQFNFIGYDESAGVLIVVDQGSSRALVYGLDGAFLGSSALGSVNPTLPSLNGGYANGQLFLYNRAQSIWQGWTVLDRNSASQVQFSLTDGTGSPTPEPSSLWLIAPALGGLGLHLFRRRG